MPVPRVRMASQINCGGVTMLNQKRLSLAIWVIDYCFSGILFIWLRVRNKILHSLPRITLHSWCDSPMISTRDFVIRDNHWQITSLVTKINVIPCNSSIILYKFHHIMFTCLSQHSHPVIDICHTGHYIGYWVHDFLFIFLHHRSTLSVEDLLRIVHQKCMNYVPVDARVSRNIYTHTKHSYCIVLCRVSVSMCVHMYLCACAQVCVDIYTI